jgi:hypothetical protein
MLSYLKEWIFAVAPYAPALPLLIGLIKFRRLPLPLKVIVVHVLVAASVEFAATVLWNYRINNLFLLHIYTVEECGFIMLFYSYLLSKLVPRKVFLYVFVAFAVLAVLNTVFLQPVNVSNTYARSVEAVIVILCAIAFFYSLLGETTIKGADRPSYVWINTAFLIYFSGSLLLFTLSNYIEGPRYRQLRMDIWTLHAFFSILLYTFIAIGLWKHRGR